MIFLLFCFVIPHAICDGTLEISESLLLRPGDEAVFWCESDFFDFNNRFWIRRLEDGTKENLGKNNQVVDYSLIHRFILSNFIAFRPNIGKRVQRYSLTIKNTKEEDAGTYECQYQLNNNTVVNRRTTLIVFPQRGYKEQISLIQGETADLQCYQDKYQIFNIIWWKNNNQPLPDGSRLEYNRLIIPSTTFDDSGIYTCKAEYYQNSDIKNTTSKSVILNIIPELDVKVKNNYITRPLGDSINLTCIIYSKIPVNVTWIKDSQVTNKYKTFIHQNKVKTDFIKNSVVVAELFVSIIEAEDYGSYKCIVENSFNKIIKGIELLPTYSGINDAKPTLQDLEEIEDN